MVANAGMIVPQRIVIGADEDDVVERCECLHDQIGAEDDVVERGECHNDQIVAEG